MYALRRVRSGEQKLKSCVNLAGYVTFPTFLLRQSVNTGTSGELRALDMLEKVPIESERGKEMENGGNKAGRRGK
ncbi:hypothetical protein Trydic_g20082 [Trypoxylus dichotomus]